MNNLNTAQLHQGLYHLVSAGRSLILVQTYEEDRLERLLRDLAKATDRQFWTWSIATGLVTAAGPIEDTEGAREAIRFLNRQKDAPLVWLRDLHHHYQPGVLRELRDLYYRWRDQGGLAVLSAPSRAIPQDLDREMAFLALDLPSPRELAEEVDRWLTGDGADLPVDGETVAAMLKGLTLSEVRHALVRVKNQRPDPGKVVRVLQEEKRQLIRKTGTLEYIHEVPPIEDLGGLENLKDWLLKRKKLLISSDSKLREIAPKGVLLMGVSGCGKSLCIKAISSAWQLPLYRMEMVKVFSGANGNPELAFEEACRLMEDMAPAILWIDEIEMSLSGEGSSAGNSELSRIFAFFLTWMQEKTPGLFVAATANRIDLLPAEMIRKGRFDQVFFVDLPSVREREDIFRIHLHKRGYPPDAFTPEVFADASSGWSGAEIEQCVIAAVTQARMEGRDLVLKDLYAAQKQIVPISTTMEEQVRHIRNWAYERAVRASATS